MTSDGLFRALESYLKSALEMMTGAEISIAAMPDAARVEGSDLWWRQALSVANQPAAVYIGAPESLWKQISGASEDAHGAKEIYFEALSQAMLRVLDDVKQDTRVAVVTQSSGEAAAPAARECHRYSVHSDESGAAGELSVVVDPAFMRALQRQRGETKSSARESLANLNAALSEPEETAGPVASRILDLQLPASIRIAQTVMPIREVLRLTPGAVVELGKSSGEPVDIVVHGTVLARGEIVAVKGYYGVRITEIVTRGERIAAFRDSSAPQAKSCTFASA